MSRSAWRDHAVEFLSMTKTGQRSRTLYAIYDLGRAPVTFDVMNFFAAAHVWAGRAGFAGFHTIFVLGEGDGFRADTLKDIALPTEEKMWRLWHILLPHAAIARHCVGASVVPDRRRLSLRLRGRDPRQVFPPGYAVDKPNQVVRLSAVFLLEPHRAELDVFGPTPAALAKVDEWLSGNAPGERPVVITLRTSRVDPERNSRLGEWLAAARAIGERGYTPIFVPDTDLVTAGAERLLFDGFPVFGLGAVDLDLRLAMYRRACLNMADNGGPAFLSYFMAESTMVCFLPVDKLPAEFGSGGASRMAELLGVEQGGDLPHATPARRFVWRPDRRDAIVEEFDRATAHLGVSGPGGPAA